MAAQYSAVLHLVVVRLEVVLVVRLQVAALRLVALRKVFHRPMALRTALREAALVAVARVIGKLLKASVPVAVKLSVFELRMNHCRHRGRQFDHAEQVTQLRVDSPQESGCVFCLCCAPSKSFSA